MFPGAFVHYKEEFEDIKGRVRKCVGKIATPTRSNHDKIKDHNVTVYVLFGCFFILQADVLRLLEFKGGEEFLCLWINRIWELSTTTKSMDNVINYEIDCRKCLNGCPFATKTNTFLSKDDGEYHGIINNFMNR